MSSARPNVLMIVTDQERFDVLGCNGSAICRTPNLDGLADGGVRFDQAFVPSALCSPSRASMLTALYPHAHGILNNTHGDDALRTELPSGLWTFPEALAAAGYRTGFVGKWHVGRELGPGDWGFADVVSIPYSVAQAEDDRALVEPIDVAFARDRMTIAGIDPRPIEETDTRRDTNAAIAMLERYAQIGEPFFLRLDYEGPHHPYMPPEPYASMYDAASIPPWPNFTEIEATKPAAQRRLRAQRGVEGLGWADWQPIVARYFGFMTFIDAEIGRVLAQLRILGLVDETIVVHTSDHGDMTGSHGGQFNKGPLMYDELYRVPLIIRDGRPAGRRGTASSLVSTLDLGPTILDLAGVPVPGGLHGRSLVPILADPGRVDSGREAVFGEYHGEEWGLYSQRMVRTENAKYVYSPHGSDELYDLEQDPYERENRIEDETLRLLAEALRRRLADWMVATDDPLARWASRVL
ncbi:MAG: sulfatase-like hydrolase/transferase [Candidatus Limnocylindrales bacterium]